MAEEAAESLETHTHGQDPKDHANDAAQVHHRRETSTDRRIRNGHAHFQQSGDMFSLWTAQGAFEARVLIAKGRFLENMGKKWIGPPKFSPDANDYAERGVVLFFVETNPDHRGNLRDCQWDACKEKIEPGDYRVALFPRVNTEDGHGRTDGADFYHVECFEHLVTLGKTNYLVRLLPLADVVMRIRRLPDGSEDVKEICLDLGAAILVLELRLAMFRLIDKVAGHGATPSTEAGGVHHPIDLSRYEGGWDIERFYHHYLPLPFQDYEDLKTPHVLSRMLGHWKRDRFLAMTPETQLTDEQKEEKKQVGEEVLKGIMPFV